jgi:putative tryptophan/tyrosine transport system substrate-binding protein
MKRREFIVGLGGATAWPLGARAQQPGLPVVGFLFSSTSKAVGPYIAGLSAGLTQTGYVEGRNVALEYQTAEDHFKRLPALANDLVRRRVAVIFTAGNIPPALAAKAATQTVPIVFMIGADPVTSGLVASLARPGGNITGVTVLAGEVMLKRLSLLRALVPTATTMGYLINHANPAVTEAYLKEQVDVVSRLGVRLLILKAANPSEIERAFATLAEQRGDALVVAADTFFTAQRAQIVALAARYQVPASYSRREFIEAGGLTSYGTNFGDAYRQAGVLCRPNFERRETWRFAGAAANPLRVRHQPQDCQDDGPRNPAEPARYRRRGDRMKRREFIAGLGAAAFPLAARVQQAAIRR